MKELRYLMRGVFLDLYGTLIITGETTGADWLEELYSGLCRCGLTMTGKEFAARCEDFFNKSEPPSRNDGLSVYERRIHALCYELGMEIGRENLLRIRTDTIIAADKSCYLDPECRKVLESLHNIKKLVLISNFDHFPHIKEVLRQMDIEKYFTDVVISSEVGLRKPDPAIFCLAMQKTGLQPDEVVHVGDSIADDITGAIAAGIMPILIRRNRPGQNELSPVVNIDHYGTPNHAAIRIPDGTRIISRLTEILDIVS